MKGAEGKKRKLVLRVRQPVLELSAFHGLACGIIAILSAGQDLAWALPAQLGTLVRPGSIGWPQHRGGNPPPWAPQMDWACLVIFTAIDAN